MLAVLRDEVYLASDLIPVGIVDPEKHVRDDSKRHPRQLKVLLDFLVLIFSVLYDGQTDIEECNGAEDADKADEVD